MLLDYVEHDLKPREILSHLSDVNAVELTEMTEWQHGFLCGLIKEFRPKKILEIGVSAGGTTAVLLNAIQLLHLDSELYSVDYSEQYYEDKTKRTGFLAEKCREYLGKSGKMCGRFELLTGGGVYGFLERIGGNIDFLILDTMHVLPGELLDFIACFPYLSENAVVVMHDIAMQYASNREAYATQLLLDVVTADKIVGRDPETGFETYPNIGAFRINQDTKKYMENVFSSLNIPWFYLPADLDEYRRIYEEHYARELMEIFDLAVRNNLILMKKHKEKRFQTMRDIMAFAREIGDEDVCIYGNGKVGKRLHAVLEACGIRVYAHIISDGQDRDENSCYLSEMKEIHEKRIIIGVGPTLQQEITETLGGKGLKDFITIGANVYRELMG